MLTHMIFYTLLIRRSLVRAQVGEPVIPRPRKFFNLRGLSIFGHGAHSVPIPCPKWNASRYVNGVFDLRSPFVETKSTVILPIGMISRCWPSLGYAVLKKIVTVCLVTAATSVQAGAFYDGNELVEKMREWEKASRLEGVASLREIGFYQGYVAGVADAFGGIAFCPPSNANVGQILVVVSKYLYANPAHWAEPATVLITDALAKAYPCPTK